VGIGKGLGGADHVWGKGCTTFIKGVQGETGHKHGRWPEISSRRREGRILMWDGGRRLLIGKEQQKGE